MAVMVSGNAAPIYQTVEAYIAAQKNIRIFADGAEGFGNQTASQNLVIRLRQMGYQGKFEFIYPGYAVNKITTLFDLPTDIPDDYFDSRSNTEFIKLKYYVENYKTMTPVELGMSGAYVGTACENAQGDNADTSKFDELTCNNFANFSKANAFVSMSPFMGVETHEEASSDDTHIFYQNESAAHVQINSDLKYIVMPVASLSDAKKYLTDDQRGRDLAIKKPILKTLIESMEQQTINVMPVYGYTLQLRNACRRDNTDNCYFNVLSNMVQIIAGASYAQNLQDSELHKPLVIPVFYDYSKEANWLLKFFHGELWGTITEPNADKAKIFIDALGLSHTFLIANADDPAAANKIKNLDDGQILLLSMGPLPKIVFDGLYTHAATNVWPQVREGANSLNSLILTGKPHIRCSEESWELDFNFIKDENLRIWLLDFYNGFCADNPNKWEDSGTISINIGRFIREAHDPKTALSQYFNELKLEALKPENDRIHFALEDVVRHE